MKCNLKIDSEPFSFQVGGKFATGDDTVLYIKHQILDACDWETDGFSIIDIFNESQFEEFQNQSLSIINDILRNIGVSNRLNNLEDYHQLVDSDELHQSVISKSRFLKSSDFSIDLNSVSEKVSNAIGKKVGIYNPKLEEEIIILRVSRPQSLDINPLHRDGYLDIWEDTINVWIPLAGCNKLSSLPVIPGSHFWNEKDVLRTEAKGAKINGLLYHVPGIIDGPGGLNTIRPNPNTGKALIFTPFLAHGAAVNQNKNTTRMSLELRLCLQ